MENKNEKIIKITKGRNWEDLTQIEKKEWEELAEKIQDKLIIWKVLCELKKCPWCKTEFEEGIINKKPGEFAPLLSFFKSGFLFHIKSTHGIDPAMFELMLLNLNIDNKIKKNKV